MKAIKPIKGIDRNKKIYECSICENWFNWGEGSTWFGSLKTMEDSPEKLIYCCSSKCKQQHESSQHPDC
jgi:hypothetical protein